MLSIDQVKMNLHTPCLMLNNKKRKSVHDLTKTNMNKLVTQNYQVLRREDHNFADQPSREKSDSHNLTNNHLYQQGINSKAVYVNIRRNKILYHGRKCILLSLRDISNN